MLLERDELTSGSTWHAAGLLPYFNMSYATTHIHDYSIKFYKTLEEETGLDAGFFVVGNLRMAQTEARMDEYMPLCLHRRDLRRALRMDDARADRSAGRWCAPTIWKARSIHPTDGYINPADVTMAMAKGARQRGVTIERKWQVDGYHWTGDHWDVTVTKMVEKGGNLVPSDETDRHHRRTCRDRHGNHAQRTAGCWASRSRHPGRTPVHRDRTRPRAGRVPQDQPRAPVLRDADAKWYVREERGGWILGPYEAARRRGSNTACPTASAPTSSRSISTGSRKNTCR